MTQPGTSPTHAQTGVAPPPSDGERKRRRLKTFTTEIEENATVEIDGDEYDILHGTQLSDEQESELMMLVKRLDRTGRDIDKAEGPKADQRVEKLTKVLTQTRKEIITKYTTIPAEKLPPGLRHQGEIVGFVLEEIGIANSPQTIIMLVRELLERAEDGKVDANDLRAVLESAPDEGDGD